MYLKHLTVPDVPFNKGLLLRWGGLLILFLRLDLCASIVFPQDPWMRPVCARLHTRPGMLQQRQGQPRPAPSRVPGNSTAENPEDAKGGGDAGPSLQA